MADKIKLRAGKKEGMPQLDQREVAYCTDENAIYVGTEDGNKKVGGDGVTEQDKQDIIDGVLDGIQGGSYEQGVEDGKKSERDRFWDIYQDYGNRRDYRNAFFGAEWVDEIYDPQYAIVCDGAKTNSDMFGFSSITDTLVPIDLSKNTSVSAQIFRGTSNLKTIRELRLHEGLTYSSWFNQATALENIVIVGTIGADFDIHWSTKLSEASGLSIINALSTTTSGLTVTLPSAWKTTYIANHGQTVFDNLMATKSNWTIDFK